jgi:hypothetical protein
MSPYKVYGLFNALKLHFKSGSKYNFHRHQGRITKLPLEEFEIKSDKVYFEKLATRKDPLNWCVANLHINPGLWIGELATPEAEDTYKQFESRKQSLTYTFEQELPKSENIKDVIKTKGHPPIVKAWLGGRTSLMTMAVLDTVVPFSSGWRTSRDPVLKECRERIIRLSPFIVFDQGKIESVLQRKYSWEPDTK